MPRVVRVIARLNVGGPAIHTILLTDLLRPQYETVLVSGVETDREGNMLPLAAAHNVDVVRIQELGREINLGGDAAALLKLWRLIRRERPDIVHTHTAKAGLVGRLAARLAGVPVVLHTFHGHVFRGYFGPMKTTFFLVLERLLARMTDVILTVNEEQRQELLGFRIAPAAKLRALPLGLDLGRLAAGDGDRAGMRAKWSVPMDAPLIGIVARLVPIKGHELFIDAAAELQSVKPDARFVLVGDGERRAELEAYAAAKGVGVVFAGWESDLPSVYAALDVVCLSSFNEGSPVALIEALTAGRPVVTTPAGGVVDLIEDGKNGLIVSERDPIAFAGAIQRLVDQPELARELGERGRASAYPRYDVSRLVADIRALYGQLLAGK
ncbi:MAG: glycosyltransferase family 4 protein [Chloroflexi bacterium]|nr:glycosyltransferase family 4 protein [Chloroflexota bacterium]